MKKSIITKIDAKTYRFTEKAFGVKVYMYLLIGAEKALLIDTGYGFTDIPATVRGLTDLPLTVVNTHGHMDHIHGNHMYPFVYLASTEEETFARHTDREYVMGLLKDIVRANHLPTSLLKIRFLEAEDVAASVPSVHRPLPENGYFELGERHVTVINTPGHTSGSICLLDEKSKWLFSGDMTCQDGVLLQFPESTEVAVFRASILKLKELVLEGKIEKLFPAHQETPLGTDILDTYMEACDILLEGRADGKTMRQGRLKYHGLTITFDKEKIRGVER